MVRELFGIATRKNNIANDINKDPKNQNTINAAVALINEYVKDNKENDLASFINLINPNQRQNIIKSALEDPHQTPEFIRLRKSLLGVYKSALPTVNPNSDYIDSTMIDKIRASNSTRSTISMNSSRSGHSK